MSAEIHGYDKLDDEYEHFDTSIRAIARVLHPEETIANTREVNWEQEIKKYLL